MATAFRDASRTEAFEKGVHNLRALGYRKCPQCGVNAKPGHTAEDCRDAQMDRYYSNGD